MLSHYAPRSTPFEVAMPWGDLHSESADADVGILGVPFDGGAFGRLGTAQAPARLRELARHKTPVTEDGNWLGNLQVRDYGDIFPKKDWKHFSSCVQTHATIALQHRFTLFLGGDHSITIPLALAFDQTVKHPWGMIQFDAHPDLAHEEQGRQWSHACTARRALELPGLSMCHLAFVGLRSFLKEEIDWLRNHPDVSWYTARQCHHLGIGQIAESIVKQMAGVQNIYFTLDIDGLDPAYAPGTGTPQAGGLSIRDLLDFIEIIFTQLPIRAMDVVEVSPPLDVSDVTSFAAIKAIYEVFGLIQVKK